jgi:hypothetical protein
MVKKQESKETLTADNALPFMAIMAIVAVVAIIGLIMMVTTNDQKSNEDFVIGGENLLGQAPSYTTATGGQVGRLGCKYEGGYSFFPMPKAGCPESACFKEDGDAITFVGAGSCSDLGHYSDDYITTGFISTQELTATHAIRF